MKKIQLREETNEKTENKLETENSDFLSENSVLKRTQINGKEYVRRIEEMKEEISRVYDDEVKRKNENRSKFEKMFKDVEKLQTKIKDVKKQTTKTIEGIRSNETSREMMDKYATSRSIIGKAILYFVILLVMIVIVKFAQNYGINLLEAYNYALGTPPPA